MRRKEDKIGYYGWETLHVGLGAGFMVVYLLTVLGVPVNIPEVSTRTDTDRAERWV